MQKVPLLLVGGKGHNLSPDLRHRFDLSHIEVDRAFIPAGEAPEAMVIVVLGAVPAGLWDQAQELARARSIPVTRVDSGNDIAGSLRRYPAIKKILDRQNRNGHGTEQEPEKASVVAPEKLEDIGLSDEDLWEQYGDKLLEAVKLVFEPGQKKREADFLGEVGEFVGIPKGAVKRALPQLDFRSVLVRIGESDSWQLLWSPDGSAIELATEPAEPETKREVKESKISARVTALTGLHPGPYKSKYQIGQTMALYTDFDSKDGKPLSATRADEVVSKAIEVGYIEENGDQFYIHQDESIKLTRREEDAPKGPPAPPVSTPSDSKKVSSKDFALVGKKEPPEPKKDVYTDNDIRKLVLPAPAVEIPLAKLEMLKSIVAIVHWDTCAIHSIHRRFDRKRVAREMIDRRLFTQDEWDAFAWETIKKFTFLQAAEALSEKPPVFEDERCICKDCGEPFVDTKDRKEKRFRRFGKSSTPRRCFNCHQQHKASQESGDDYDPRLPING